MACTAVKKLVMSVSVVLALSIQPVSITVRLAIRRSRNFSEDNGMTAMSRFQHVSLFAKDFYHAVNISVQRLAIMGSAISARQ